MQAQVVLFKLDRIFLAAESCNSLTCKQRISFCNEKYYCLCGCDVVVFDTTVFLASCQGHSRMKVLLIFSAAEGYTDIFSISSTSKSSTHTHTHTHTYTHTHTHTHTHSSPSGFELTWNFLGSFEMQISSTNHI